MSRAGRRRRLARTLLGVAVFAAALLAWEVAAEGSFQVPTASEVADRAWQDWPSAEFRSDVTESLKRLAAGFVLGAGLGVAAGLLMGSSHALRRALDPLVELTRATPPIALVPALVVLLDYGDSMQIAVIAFGVCFPVLVNTVDGIRAVSPEARDTASMLQVGRVERIFRINLPAALPSIFAGLRIAVSVGLVMVVISEFAGTGDGLGRYIVEKQGQVDVTGVWAGILFLGLLGLVLNRLFLLVERRALAWHHGATGERLS
ncbi:MAG TPA: ABC transporter permease [Gaiellaceae bacterium]|nr:ABC transporter permease [Gaiellaceae bacterium]